MNLPLSSAAPGDLAAVTSTAGWIVPLAVGVVLVGLLIGLVWWDDHRRRERAPRPDEQPRRPDHRTEISEVREPEELSRSKERLLPHELKHQGTHTAPPGTPPRDDSSGSGFGSGGFGG